MKQPFLRGAGKSKYLGLDDDFNNELTLLFVLLAFGVYGIAFRWASGKRISTEEAAIVSAYTMGPARRRAPWST